MHKYFVGLVDSSAKLFATVTILNKLNQNLKNVK